MDSTLRVVISPADETGCGHYRCIYPSMALAGDSSVDIEILPRVLERLILTDPGVMVLQRPVFWSIAEKTIPYLRARGWAIVVEVDDNLSRLQPTHFAFYTFHQNNKEANWKALEACAAQADLVTCTTEGLVRQYGSHGRVAVIPNYVPERYLVDSVPKEPDEKLFGWPGTLASHPGDLDIAAKAIRRTASNPGWRFAGLGDPGTCKYLGVDGEFLQGTTMEDWVPALSQLQLGVAPLASHRFNEDKSYLKGLELAARGVPFVASSTQPYRELERMGAGVTATTQKDWIRTLTDMLSNPGRRQYEAEMGLEVARENTYEKNSWRWVEAWHQARSNYDKNITETEIEAGRGIHADDLVIR